MRLIVDMVLATKGEPGEYKEQKITSGKKKNHTFKTKLLFCLRKDIVDVITWRPGPKKVT